MYVRRVSGFRVVEFWGSCLIIYLYNLQKMWLVERGGLSQATLGILEVKSCFSSYQHNSLSEKVKPMNKQPILHWIFCPHSMLYSKYMYVSLF